MEVLLNIKLLFLEIPLVEFLPDSELLYLNFAHGTISQTLTRSMLDKF